MGQRTLLLLLSSGVGGALGGLGGGGCSEGRNCLSVEFANVSRLGHGSWRVGNGRLLWFARTLEKVGVIWVGTRCGRAC